MGDFVNSLTIAQKRKQKYCNFQRTKNLFMGTKFYKDAKIPPPTFYSSQFPNNITFSDRFIQLIFHSVSQILRDYIVIDVCLFQKYVRD